MSCSCFGASSAKWKRRYGQAHHDIDGMEICSDFFKFHVLLTTLEVSVCATYTHVLCPVALYSQFCCIPLLTSSELSRIQCHLLPLSLFSARLIS